MAYQEEFKEDEQKIWFVISYLGTKDGSQCVASDWLQNWKEDNMYNHTLHADTYKKFIKDLTTAFEDPNLKVNMANDLQQLQQGKDTLVEYFTKFELKATTAGYRQVDNVLIDLLKNQVQHEIHTELYRGGILIPTTYAGVKQRLQWVKKLSTCYAV